MLVIGDVFYQGGENISLAFPEYGVAEIKWIVRQWHSLPRAQMNPMITALSTNAPKLSFTYNIKTTEDRSEYPRHANSSYMAPTDLGAEVVVARDMSITIREDRAERGLETKRAAPLARKGLKRPIRGN